MCGINGIVKFGNQTVSKNEIEKMNFKIRHRGPDDEGIFVNNNIGLGHLRLSILDLSKNGHQPMNYDKNGHKFTITFNGEIYNFLELRDELQKKGYQFKSNTDTEVILASYIEEGPKCIEKFNGMFAFVIYDPVKKILFGARDRLGQKPLKYYLDEDKFIFSSELKAILQNNIEREIDYEAIDDYLTLQYVPAPKTGFKNIFKLSHSHYFIFDIAEFKLEIHKYFDLDFSKKLKLSKQEWMDLIEEELSKSVKRRLISDVPLGAFLSGGIDSSAVVAFMSKYTNKVKTYSISFNEKDFDESTYARKVAELFNTDHTEFKVNSDDLPKHIEELVIHYEEPFADSSLLPTFLLSKLARKHVTVALSGDAGDENFGGYEKHKWHAFKYRHGLLLKFLAFIAMPVHLINKLVKNDLLEKMYIFLKTMNKNIAIQHYNFTSYFDEFKKNKLYKPEFKAQLKTHQNPFEKILENKKFEDLDKVYYLDFNSYIPDDINVKVDMASMRSALEVRSPMMDFNFLQTTAKIPWQLKSNTKEGKIIFKKMLEKYLPKKLIYRKKKGFSIPIKYWFRNELSSYVKNEILNKHGLAVKIFKEEELRQLINQHGKKDHAKKLWTLMSLNIWHRHYFCQIAKSLPSTYNEDKSNYE